MTYSTLLQLQGQSHLNYLGYTIHTVESEVPIKT